MSFVKRSPSFARRTASALFLALAAVGAACTDASAPNTKSADSQLESAIASARGLASTMPEAYIAQGLLRTAPLRNSVTVTKVIPNGGGSVDVPGTDFKLIVPKGAFNGPSMTFSVTAFAGNTVAYDFEPHGATFLKALTFQQQLSHTNLKGFKPAPGFVPDFDGAYFPSSAMVDKNTGIAVVTELLSTGVPPTWTGSEITFPIWHFSGYMISTGRSSGGY